MANPNGSCVLYQSAGTGVLDRRVIKTRLFGMTPSTPIQTRLRAPMRCAFLLILTNTLYAQPLSPDGTCVGAEPVLALYDLPEERMFQSILYNRPILERDVHNTLLGAGLDHDQQETSGKRNGEAFHYEDYVHIRCWSAAQAQLVMDVAGLAYRGDCGSVRPVRQQLLRVREELVPSAGAGPPSNLI